MCIAFQAHTLPLRAILRADLTPREFLAPRITSPTHARRRVRHTPQAMSPLDWLNPFRARGPVAPPATHAALGTPVRAPAEWGAPHRVALFGMGCFWGAEKLFWQTPGVHSTSVGYAGGAAAHPSYGQVCSGRSGHAEVVSVVYDEGEVSFRELLDVFWAGHDPTTRNRQGNDVGTQYRSAVFYYDQAQKDAAQKSKEWFNGLLKAAGRNAVVTEIAPAGEYYFAEEYHQQYLHKNPGGYCGLGGTGVYRPPPKE